jgi:lysozyme
MEISEKGIGFLISREGFKCNTYFDSVGYLTIGVGHLLTSQEKDTGYIMIAGQPCYYMERGLRPDKVKLLLKQDCANAIRIVSREVKVPLSQSQFDALISFVFNIGTHAFSKSTLLKVLNAGQYAEVPAQLRRWNKAGGVVVEGLKNRREFECALWSNGKY